MKKLVHFNELGEIAQICTIEDALTASYVAANPRWTALEIAHEDERTLAAAGGPERHFCAIAGDASVARKATVIARSLDGMWEVGIHPKEIVTIAVEGSHEDHDCECGADAHTLAPDQENKVAGATLHLMWNCPQPVKLWVGVEPVAGPVGGFCQDSVDFTPPTPGVVKIIARHPRYFFEPIRVHALEPLIAEETKNA
jgi:hypothetical protein